MSGRESPLVATLHEVFILPPSLLCLQRQQGCDCAHKLPVAASHLSSQHKSCDHLCGSHPDAAPLVSVHQTAGASLSFLDEDEDGPWVLVEFEPLSEPDITAADVPPPPDPKTHPGGATGGLLQRVLREMDTAGEVHRRKEGKGGRWRKDGLIWRIRSAL